MANHIRVRPENLPDNAVLSREVTSALLRDPYGSRFDMKVSASNSRVYLQGRVESSFEKNHAEFVASRVPGVVDVKNNLEVVDLEVPSRRSHPGRRLNTACAGIPISRRQNRRIREGWHRRPSRQHH